MLDLTVEFRPCPGGTFGFSDSMSTLTLGRREVPFMIDNNPSMYKSMDDLSAQKATGLELVRLLRVRS